MQPGTQLGTTAHEQRRVTLGRSPRSWSPVLLHMPPLSSLACALVVAVTALLGCGTDQTCGDGAWRPGRLEIHHLAVGQADATLIIAPSGRSLLVDAGETGWERRTGAQQVSAALDRTLGCRRIDMALITHFHLDHVGAPGRGGLAGLVSAQAVVIGTTWHRDLARYPGADGVTLSHWRRYLSSAEGQALHPRNITKDVGEIDLGPGVSVRVVAADGAGTLPAIATGLTGSPGLAGASNENDHSVAIWLRYGRLDYFIGGDLSGELVRGVDSTSHDVETEVARRLPDIDVYRANHHGSNHSSNPTFLAQIDPEVSIVSVGDPSPHGHPGEAALARLLSTGAVYLTTQSRRRRDLGAAISGGDVTVASEDGITYTVSGVAVHGAARVPFVHHFTAADPVRADVDGDGYFVEADPDDGDAAVRPAPNGGCDRPAQICGD